MSEQENNISLNKSTSQLPIYERPGRLDPDRHIPMVRPSRVDVNIHYSDGQQGYFKDSNVPEFTDESANAMDPFEDTALLSGDIKPRVVAVRTGAPKMESKIFVPELDTTEVRAKIRKPVLPQEPEKPIFIADEDKAASSDLISSAFSGVESEVAVKQPKTDLPSDDVAKLKMYTLLLGVVIIMEITGILLLTIL